jgi:4-amino-4-deoxychorismate lyase
MSNRTLLYGEGLFETILWKGRTPKLRRHYDRLRSSASYLRIPCPDYDDFLGFIEAKAGRRRGIYLKFCLLSHGDGTFYSLPSAYRPLIVTKRLPKTGADVTLAVSHLRRHSLDPLCRHKTMNYTFSILVKREALSQGYTDAMVLNERNEVTECSSSNILLLNGETLLTPAVECGLLKGTTLQVLTDRFPVREDHLTVRDVMRADALFVTNSIAGILPVRKVLDRTLDIPEIMLSAMRRTLDSENRAQE